MRSLPLLSICSLMIGLTAGCGGGGTQTIPPPPPSLVSSVTVSSSNASILVKATQQFTATIQGSGNFNPAVIWYVNNVQGGNSTVGTINASGLYTAPNTVPTPNSVTHGIHSGLRQRLGSVRSQFCVLQGGDVRRWELVYCGRPTSRCLSTQKRHQSLLSWLPRRERSPGFGCRPQGRPILPASKESKYPQNYQGLTYSPLVAGLSK